MKRILTIAGSDSSGGAGIQADLKTITALGGYGMSAITALTAQNTQGVFEIVACDPAFVSLQIDLVLSDIGADVIKTGMLFNHAIIASVADMLKLYPHIPYIIDPVMVSTSGSVLLKEDAIESLIELLIPQAALVTPNIPEAELLAEMNIRNRDDMQNAGERILKMGAKAVLIKGGHGRHQTIDDMLICSDKPMVIYEHPRIGTKHTHGTGCTLASAIATFIAQEHTLEEAVRLAGDYVAGAITHAPGFGKGNGPLNHSWNV